MGVADETVIAASRASGNPSIISVKILDADEEDGRFIVSNRKALLSDESKNALIRGNVVPGTVSGIRPYGIFIELDGGSNGLLHVSQISFEKRDDFKVESLFTIGQRVKVMILDFDPVSGRVALGTKMLEATPGDIFRDSAHVFEHAEQTAKLYRERNEAAKIARENAAKEMVTGLGNALSSASGSNSGNSEKKSEIGSVVDSIESILASIIGETSNTNNNSNNNS
jgi:predicted RNA-binding protein with RPS1 domain